tara:strand:+ start:203 stop:730 length:528 start_codon:yes stop_codon:yes gene_type:complete
MGILVGNQMPEAIINVGTAPTKGATNYGYFMNSYGAIYESGSNQTNSGGFASDFKKELFLPNYQSDTFVSYLYGAVSQVSGSSNLFYLSILSNNTTLYDNRESFTQLDGSAELPFASVCVDGTMYKIADSTSRTVTSQALFTSDASYYAYQTIWSASGNTIGTTTDIKKEIQFKG